MYRTARLRCFTARRTVLSSSQYHRSYARDAPSIFSARISSINHVWATHYCRGTTRDLRAFSSNVERELDPVHETSSHQDVNKEIHSLLDMEEVTKAGNLLNQAQTEAFRQNDLQLLPNIRSYTAYLNTLLATQKQFVHSDEETVVRIASLAEKAHDLLVHMEDISGVSDEYSSVQMSGIMKSGIRQPNLRPTSSHYDAVILAFANATCAANTSNFTTNFTMNAPYIAQRWLQRMETLALDANSGVAPTLESYHNVMRSCSVIAMMNKQSKSPILTQAIFEKLKNNKSLSPTAREYRLLLQTWSSSLCKDSAYKATGVWMSMQRAFRMGNQEMEPSLDDAKMVLEAHSRAINKHSARRAHTILNEMEKLYTHKKTLVKPDLDCYRLVLQTMSKSKVPEIGVFIPKLFKSMEDNHIFPDTECFDSAIEALTNCARSSKEEKTAVECSKLAEQMLLQMEKENERSSVSIVTPNTKSYTNTIRALGTRHTKHAAEKAAELLKRMETAFSNGDESMRPTQASYVGVIHAYGTCGSGRSFVKANEVLQRMLDEYSNGNEAARPTVCSYHAVIQACAESSMNKTTEIEKEALVLAISTVQAMKKSDHIHPNAKSYLLLLQCCIHLLPEGNERERALCSVFRSCAKDGLVNQQMLQDFQSVVSSEVYHREVVCDAPYFEEVRILPEKWTRNLGYRIRVKGSSSLDGGSGKRSPIISVSGNVISTTAYNDYRMRRRWSKRGKMLLQGGRI